MTDFKIGQRVAVNADVELLAHHPLTGCNLRGYLGTYVAPLQGSKLMRVRLDLPQVEALLLPEQLAPVCATTVYRPEPPYTEEACPGHVAAPDDSKVCGRCGVHIDSLRP